jgi:hypothetical protein
LTDQRAATVRERSLNLALFNRPNVIFNAGPHPDIPGAWQVLYDYFLKDGRGLLGKSEADKRAHAIADAVIETMRNLAKSG